MKRKLLVILMTIALVATTIVGCGKDESTNTGAETGEAESEGYGSLNDNSETSRSVYVGDVEHSIDGTAFLINVAAKEESKDQGFVGQMYMNLDENSMEFAELLKPGKTVVLVLVDDIISNIYEASEDEVKLLQELRASASTYEDDIAYIKTIPGSEIKAYANSVYATWTDKQIEDYSKALDELLKDTELATAYNESAEVNKVMTATERAADYEANKDKYEVVTEDIVSSDDSVIDEADMPKEYNPEETYTDEEMNYLIESGVLVQNEDGSITYPDGTLAVIGLTKDEITQLEAEGLLVRGEDGFVRYANSGELNSEETLAE